MEKGKEIAVKITAIGNLRDTKAGKLQEIEVKKLDGTGNLEVGVFLHDNGFNFQVGDEVLMNITSKEFKGKTYYSSGVESIKPFTNGKVSQKVWEDKDARMVRMNSLSHAVKIIELYYTLTKQTPTAESELTNMVLLQAGVIEVWINNQKEETPF